MPSAGPGSPLARTRSWRALTARHAENPTRRRASAGRRSSTTTAGPGRLADRRPPRSSAERRCIMRSSKAALEPQADPLAPVHELADWLLGTTTHVLIGLLVGMLAARLMRRRHLHWSWAATGLTSVVLVGHAYTGS